MPPVPPALYFRICPCTHRLTREEVEEEEEERVVVVVVSGLVSVWGGGGMVSISMWF